MLMIPSILFIQLKFCSKYIAIINKWHLNAKYKFYIHCICISFKSMNEVHWSLKNS